MRDNIEQIVDQVEDKVKNEPAEGFGHLSIDESTYMKNKGVFNFTRLTNNYQFAIQGTCRSHLHRE